MKFIGLALLCFLGPVLAKAPQVPTSVTEVHTGGWWQAQGKSGRYRVLVVDQGWEHVWSTVFVQWVSEPSGAEFEQEIVSSFELGSPLPSGSAVMSASLRHAKAGEVIVDVKVTPNTVLKAKPKRFTFCAREPGAVALCKPTK